MSRAGSSLEQLTDALDELAAAGHEQLALQLGYFVQIIAHEAAGRPSFARSLSRALANPTPEATRTGPARPSGRRAPGVLDPYALYMEMGEAGLQNRLSLLTVDELKDLISEHGMDRDKLTMKWKRPERLVERIVEMVRSRINKGEVFRDNTPVEVQTPVEVTPDNRGSPNAGLGSSPGTEMPSTG